MDESERDRDREEFIRCALNDSPYYRYINMRVVEFTDTGSVMEMDVIPEHKNIWGTVHGGAVASLVDSSCGTAMAPVMRGEAAVVTLDLKVQLLRPVREGSLKAVSKVVHVGKRIVISECEVYNDEGKLAARGSSIHTKVGRSDA